VTTRKRRTSSRRRRTTSRSTSRAGYRRRRTPTVASSVGTAVGLLVVATLLDASWPVRIGLVVLGVLVVGGYFVLKERGRPAGADEGAAPGPDNSPVPPTTTTEDPA
jgi:hypothetical protein